MRDLTEELYAYALADAVASGFMTSIGNRFYDTEAPQGAAYPYVVYLVVTDIKDWQFVERFEDVSIQFSIFSTASSSGEAKDIYTKLVALFDEQYLNIIGMVQFLWMWRNTTSIMKEEYTTKPGTVGIWHIAVDFDLYYEV